MDRALLYFSPKSTNIGSMEVTVNSWLQTSPVTLVLLIGPRITLRIQVNFFHSMSFYFQFKLLFWNGVKFIYSEKATKSPRFCGLFRIYELYIYFFLCTLNVKIWLHFFLFGHYEVNRHESVYFSGVVAWPLDILIDQMSVMLPCLHARCIRLKSFKNKLFTH